MWSVPGRDPGRTTNNSPRESDFIMSETKGLTEVSGSLCPFISLLTSRPSTSETVPPCPTNPLSLILTQKETETWFRVLYPEDGQERVPPRHKVGSSARIKQDVWTDKSVDPLTVHDGWKGERGIEGHETRPVGTECGNRCVTLVDPENFETTGPVWNLVNLVLRLPT